MAKKKDKPQVINNIGEINLEIDYDKLAEAIVKANSLYQEKIKEQEKEKKIKNRMKAFENMNMLKYFDKDGNTKKELKKRHKLIIVLKSLFAKDKNWELILNTSDEYLEFSILPTTINLLPYVLFLLIEWGLYFLSGGLLIYAITQIAINFSHIPWYILLKENIFRIVLAISSFILSRGFIRFLKIDCKHSNDKHYMLNFLALVVSVVAIIVAIIVR